MADDGLADATGCQSDHLEPRWAVVELTMLDTTSLDAVTSLCAECWALGMAEFLTGMQDEPARYEIRGVRKPTDEELQDDLAARIPEGKPQALGGAVEADYAEITHLLDGWRSVQMQPRAPMLAVLLAEHRQYLDAFSHAQQLREHYRATLEFVLAMQSHLHFPVSSDYDQTVVAAREALRNPPEWDRKPRR